MDPRTFRRVSMLFGAFVTLVAVTLLTIDAPIEVWLGFAVVVSLGGYALAIAARRTTWEES